MGKKNFTREDIAQVLKELDARSEKTIGRKALNQRGINSYWIYTLIPEGLTKFKKNLGLKISKQEDPHSYSGLLEEIDKIVSKLRRIPTWIQLRRETGITDKVFIRNFGKKGIHEVFVRYLKWLKNSKPESENIKLVDEYLNGQSKEKSLISQSSKRNIGIDKLSKYQRVSGKIYGGQLNFGNLVYEPVNELGVVFLFGMISEKLGFNIDRIGPEFPDCEAKRCVGGKQKVYQPVKIEFEYKSRQYDHPLEDCDIIVCWENNWKDCPLEIIELRSEIEKLREKRN